MSNLRVKKVLGVRYSLALLSVGCIFPIALMAAFLIFNYYEREQSQLTETAISRARAMVSSVDKEFATAEAALQGLATSPLLKKESLGDLHAQILTALPKTGAEQILLFDASRRMLFTTQRPYEEHLPDLPTPPPLTRLFDSGQPGISDLFLGRIVQRQVFVVSVPVKQAGSIAYFLNASFAPKKLSSVLVEQKFPATWRATIADSTGSVVARTNEIERFLGKKVNPDLLARLETSDEGAFKTKTLDGIPVLTIYSRSPLSRWIVVLGMPLDELTAGLRRTLVGLIVATFAALGVGFAMAWYIGGLIAKSVTALIKPALALALGDEDALVMPHLHLKEANAVATALVEASLALKSARQASHHDSLTGLSNRVLFNIVVDQQISLCQRSQAVMAILYIDLDGFKAVNDTFGHATGDQLLKAVATRLREALRDSDIIARLGGDEFAVALVHSDLANAQSIAGKLINVLSVPYVIDSVSASISASVGIAAYPDCATSTDTLLSKADQAMYAAKSLGKKQFCVAT